MGNYFVVWTKGARDLLGNHEYMSIALLREAREMTPFGRPVTKYLRNTGFYQFIELPESLLSSSWSSFLETCTF